MLTATLSVATGGFGHVGAVYAATTPTLTIADTNYPIPAGALFVSPSGSDANPGTQAAPLATLGRAIAIASSGATIVLRGGTYRESINSIYRQVTIQAYPHEQAWLDGRQVVTGWAAAGSAWVRTGWNPGLCRNCFDPNAILPSAPAAGLPDMVFVDGAALAQVTSLSALTASTFYVDSANSALYLGSDPAGHVVEATVFTKAMQFSTTGATGSAVRGIGVIGYGSYWNAGMAMVINGSPNVTFENDTFAWSASRGLSIVAAGAVVRGSTFLYNGYQGIVANNAAGLVIETTRFGYSNQEHFVYGWSSAAGAAGVKVTSTNNVTVRDSVFDDNAATGLWFDQSSQGITLVRNLVENNLWDGISVELSDTALVSSNVLTGNGGLGLKISGATNARVWNNTMANNATAQLGVYEDKRSNTNAAQRALGITWDTANVAIQNNILASDDGRATLPLVHTYDGNSPKQAGASQMISAMDFGVYARASTATPKYQDYWVTLTPTNYATNYATLAQFRTGTGFEPSGVELLTYSSSPLFASESTGDYHLVAGSPAAGNGRALPSDIAAAVGVAAGVAVDRGVLVWPAGIVYTPPTTTTTTTTTTVAPSTTTTTTVPATTTTTTTVPAPVPAAVYGLANPTTGDRIYTTSASEVTNKVALGYTAQGVVFHAATAPATGMVAVYRLRGTSNNHIYTPWATERTNLVAVGWTLEGTAFYARTSTASGFVQVYRYYSTVTYDHYLATNPAVPAGSRFDANLFWTAP